MAVVTPVSEVISPSGLTASCVRVTYVHMRSGDIGTPSTEDTSTARSASVQITGQLSGALVKVAGTNDGETFMPLHDQGGVTLGLSSSGIKTIAEGVMQLRPEVTGGDEDTDVTVTLLFREGMMADAPTTQQALDIISPFVERMRQVVAWHDDMQAKGGLEQAASEALGRAQAAQRDAVTAQQQALDAKAAQEAAEKAADGVRAQAEADRQVAENAATRQAQDIVDQAKARAASIVQAAQERADQIGASVEATNTQADHIVQDAQDRANAIASEQASAEQVRDKALADAEAAKAQLRDFQRELAALKARLG